MYFRIFPFWHLGGPGSNPHEYPRCVLEHISIVGGLDMRHIEKKSRDSKNLKFVNNLVWQATKRRKVKNWKNGIF